MMTTMQIQEQIDDGSSRKDLLEQAFDVILRLDDLTLTRIMEAINEKTA